MCYLFFKILLKSYLNPTKTLHKSYQNPTINSLCYYLTSSLCLSEHQLTIANI